MSPGKVTAVERSSQGPLDRGGSLDARFATPLGASRSTTRQEAAGAGVWAPDEALMAAMGLGADAGDIGDEGGSLGRDVSAAVRAAVPDPAVAAGAPAQRAPLHRGSPVALGGPMSFGGPMGPIGAGPRLGGIVTGPRSPQLDAFKYFEQHGRRHFAELRDQEMGPLTLATGSPYASWVAGDSRSFGRWFSHQLVLQLPANPWDLLEQTLAPTNVWQLLEAGRDAANPDDPAQANAYQSAVTQELEKAYRERLREALARLMPRLVHEWNRRTLIDHTERSQGASIALPEHPETSYPGVGVQQSHPIDRHVLAALSTVGASPSLVKVDFAAYRKAFPAEARPHGARDAQTSLRKVAFEWQAPQGARRWIKVTDPIDARPEEVAAELFGDPLLTYLITPAAPLFGFEVQKHPLVPHHGKAFSRFSGGSSGTPGQEILSGTGPLADPAALNQAAGLTAGKASRSAVIQELELLIDELQKLTAHAATWLTFDQDVIQAIVRAEVRKQRLAGGDASEADAWNAQIREQLEIVGKCGRGIEIVGKLYKVNPDDKEGRELTWEIGGLFYQAAVHSDLVATASQQLDRANQRLLAMPVDWIEVQFRWIRRALAASQKNARTGKDDAFVAGLAAKEERLRGQVMKVRDQLLSNPLAIRDELTKLTGELQQLATAAATVRNLDACNEAFVQVKEARSATGWIRSLASNPVTGNHGNDRLGGLAERADKFQAQWDAVLRLWQDGKQAEAAAALEKHAATEEWRRFFGDVAREITDQARYDAWMTFGLLVGIAVVTGFAGAIVEPLAAGLAGPILGFAITTTSEAALFTSLSYLLVDQHPSLRGLRDDFAKNVAVFGVLKGVGKAWGALEQVLGVEIAAGELIAQFATVNGLALYEANREKARRGETLTEGEILKLSFDNLVFLLAVALGSKAVAPAFGRWRLRGKVGEQLTRLEQLHQQVEALAAQAKATQAKTVAEQLLERQRQLLEVERLFLESLQELTRKGWEHARQQGMTREQFDAVHAAEKELAGAMHDLRTAEILATLEPVMAGQYLAEPGAVYEAARDHFLADRQSRGTETRGEGGLRSLELHLPDGSTLHLRERAGKRGEVSTDTRRVATAGGEPPPPRAEEVAKAHGIEPAQAQVFDVLYKARPTELLHWLETLKGQPGLANRLLALFGEAALASFKPTEGGLLDLHGKLDISAGKLATLSDADLGKLEKVCSAKDAPVADFEYFESTSTKEGKPGSRLRFKSRVATRTLEVVAKLLESLHLDPGSIRAQQLEKMGADGEIRLWDLFNEPGYKDPAIRKQAASWALSKTPATPKGFDARTFVAAFQFYDAEVANRSAQIFSNAKEAATTRAAEMSAVNGKPLSPLEIREINKVVTRELLGIGLADLGPVARRASTSKALKELANADTSGASPTGSPKDDIDTLWQNNMRSQQGPYQAGARNIGTATDSELPEKVQKMAMELGFSTQSDGAYHAHKHAREISPLRALESEMTNYLTEARASLTRKRGVVRQNQNGSRSVVVEEGGMRAIVTVDAKGDASISTFGRQ